MKNTSAVSTSNGCDLPALPPDVLLTTLENGLTIIVREDHNAPVASIQAWCMAGSIHEGDWMGAGISHVLEHMLFKGTKSRSGTQIDHLVQEAGGYINAYTSFDRTVYHIDVPNTGAHIAVDLLCDIMQNASIPADDLEKEKEVIVREMDMNFDDPGRRASRRLFECAYTRSPYRFTVIGYPDIFNELKADDIKRYYAEKYAPNNVFFVVVGDVSAEEVVKQIREAYAGSKARSLQSSVLPDEPPQGAAREILEEAPVELGYVHMAWHLPGLRHPDIPTLDVLAVILGHGRSSRLYEEVRQKQGVVTSIDTWSYNPGQSGLLGVSATVEPAKFEQARDAIAAEIEKLRTTPVSEAEVGKAIKQFVSATLASRKTMQGQAQDLGASWLTSNDLNFSERYLGAVRKVTAADLLRVAKQYLAPSGRTLYALLPDGTLPKRDRTKVARTENPVQKIDLPNGLKLLVRPDHRLPFVEFRAVFQGGVLAETPETSGITQMMGKLLLKGTTTRSAEEIAREIESVGGSIDTYGGNNSFGLNAEVLRSEFDLGLDLVQDVLLNPGFPAPALERERDNQLAAIRAQKDHLLQCAAKAMRREMFGARGYGLDILGSEESVKSLSPEQLRHFYSQMTAPQNCVLAVFGDIDVEAVKAGVEKRFGAWRGTTQPQMDAVSPIVRTGPHRTAATRDKKQAVVVVGFPGTSLHARDRYALELLQEACSDLGSRLFVRIREELGLAYYVGAQNFVGLSPGYFAFYAGTEPESAKLLEEELIKQANVLKSEGLTSEELSRAKAKIIGQKKIARQDLGGLALASALDELYGLGYDHNTIEDALYESVTLEQVKAAAETYFLPEKMIISVIQPE